MQMDLAKRATRSSTLPTTRPSSPGTAPALIGCDFDTARLPQSRALTPCIICSGMDHAFGGQYQGDQSPPTRATRSSTLPTTRPSSPGTAPALIGCDVDTAEATSITGSHPLHHLQQHGPRIQWSISRRSKSPHKSNKKQYTSYYSPVVSWDGTGADRLRF